MMVNIFAKHTKIQLCFQMTSFGCQEITMTSFNPFLEYRVRFTILLAALCLQQVSLQNFVQFILLTTESQKWIPSVQLLMS